MNKVQVLQAVAERIDLDLFYTLSVGRTLDVNLQGDLTPQSLTTLSGLEGQWSCHKNGWMQLDLQIGDIKVDVTLVPTQTMHPTS